MRLYFVDSQMDHYDDGNGVGRGQIKLFFPRDSFSNQIQPG